VEKTLCWLFGILYLEHQLEHSWTHIQMVLSVLICQLITSILLQLEMTFHRLLHSGTGQMKKKKGPLWVFNSNVQRNSYHNTGLNLTLTIHKSLQLTVVREFFSSIGKEEFHNSNTTPQDLKEKISMIRRELRQLLPRLYSSLTRKLQLLQLKWVWSLCGIDHLSLKDSESRMKRDWLKSFSWIMETIQLTYWQLITTI